jgi:hypothetical protein
LLAPDPVFQHDTLSQDPQGVGKVLGR